MISEFKEENIKDIAKSQLLSWKKAFKGILSNQLLSNLEVRDFENNWENILTQKERKNFVWLNEDRKGIGFISYGKPKDRSEIADYEIYGIYVHPKYWGNKIGYELMNFALISMRRIKPSSKTILWTMSGNTKSQKFYNQYGFKESGNSRISQRNGEQFKEIQFEIAAENAI